MPYTMFYTVPCNIHGNGNSSEKSPGPVLVRGPQQLHESS